MSLQQSPTSVIEHAGVHNELLFIPISIAIAVLRSRLYDIDTVINKALVYGLLSALLAAVYTSLIFTLQYLLHGIINQNNDVAIVVSTLTIATLFHPCAAVSRPSLTAVSTVRSMMRLRLWRRLAPRYAMRWI
jgi:hypothetical protein